MFGINPVAWFESAINAKLEREFAELLLGTALSMLISFLAGLGKIPLIGKALVDAGGAAKINLSNYKNGEALKKFSVTYPKNLDDPDYMARFVTISKQG